MAITHAKFGNGTTITFASSPAGTTINSTLQSIAAQGGSRASEIVTGLGNTDGYHKRIYADNEELDEFELSWFQVGEFPPTAAGTLTINYGGTSATYITTGRFTVRTWGNSENEAVRMMTATWTPDGDTVTLNAA